MEVLNTSYDVDATPRPAQDNGIIYDLDPSFLGHKKGAKLKHMLFFVHPALPLVDGRIVYWRIPHNEPTLHDDAATRRLWVKIQDATHLEYITVASSKLNPALATYAVVGTFKTNADIIRFGLDKKNGDVRETCGYGCQGGLIELGQFAKALGLVEYDRSGNAVGIKPLKKDYFKRYGLPEADIVKLVTDLSASGVRKGLQLVVPRRGDGVDVGCRPRELIRHRRGTHSPIGPNGLEFEKETTHGLLS